jgi:hypothetical protein
MHQTPRERRERAKLTSHNSNCSGVLWRNARATRERAEKKEAKNEQGTKILISLAASSPFPADVCARCGQKVLRSGRYT